MPSRDDELGALWLRESKDGRKYLSGKTGDQEVVVFKNDHKQPGERTPDYRVYRSQPRAQHRSETGTHAAPTRAQAPPESYDDEIPF
jgi:uncharacterized protein (DUF736 family)